MKTIPAAKDPYYPRELFTKLGFTADDFNDYLHWVRYGTFYANLKDLKRYARLFQRLADAVPKKYQDAPPSVIYRGIRISKKAMKKFESGESIPLKDRYITSWTASKVSATKYANDVEGNEAGLVITAKPKGIILCIGYKFQAFLHMPSAEAKKMLKLGKEYNSAYDHANGFEVIVRGPLVKTLTKKNAS